MVEIVEKNKTLVINNLSSRVQHVMLNAVKHLIQKRVLLC